MRIRTMLCVAALSVGGVLFQAAPASAACAVYPGTNEIRIWIGGGDPPTRGIPATPYGLVGICVDVAGDPSPQVGTNLTVTPGENCGIPCLVVAYDGVSTNPVTITVTVIVNNVPTSVPVTLPGGAYGSFCINAGMPCP